MINPIKRAAIALGVSIVLVVAVMCIPTLKDSKLADFCRGLSVGLGGVSAIAIVVLLVQRRNLKGDEQQS